MYNYYSAPNEASELETYYSTIKAVLVNKITVPNSANYINRDVQGSYLAAVREITIG
jgi:hypothetical protein